MEKERKSLLKGEDELVLPAGLFLYVLKILKEENRFDSIRTEKFIEISKSVFGNRYVIENWEITRRFLLANGWIEIFSGLVEKDELYKFTKITKEGEWLITNGVPGNWCKDTIETAVKNLKIKD